MRSEVNGHGQGVVMKRPYQRELVLRIYLPKFLANVGVYFTGATTEKGEPLVYEEIVIFKYHNAPVCRLPDHVAVFVKDR